MRTVIVMMSLLLLTACGGGTHYASLQGEQTFNARYQCAQANYDSEGYEACFQNAMRFF